ncbi:MAG: hypothetical protein JXB24_03680 [Bacteroidales bacterium]|nr:hypothetical protein [Bacteroidales bacterium]
MNRIVLILCSIALCIDFACIETEPVSPVPEVAFTSIELVNLVDTSLENPYLKGAILKFEFKDGDADFGVYESVASDTSLPDSIRYNLFMDPFYKIDGAYFRVELDTNYPPPYYSIFYNQKLDRVGQNKTVKGTITLTITDIPLYDTIKYDFYIRDRAGNNSNVESTTDLGTN